MKCKECSDNYLYQILDKCIEDTGSNTRGFAKFYEIHSESGDPRTILGAVQDLVAGECDSCKEYRKYYKGYLN